MVDSTFMADRQGENTAVSDDYVAEEVEYDGVGSSDEFAELEDDIDSLEALREQRREELKRESAISLFVCTVC